MTSDYEGHFADDGPVRPTTRFLDALLLGDYGAIWDEMDANLRTVRAQAWIWNNRHGLGISEKDGLWILSHAESHETDLWADFAASEVHAYQQAWSGWLELFAGGRLGAASRTRLVGPDLEVVLWAETDPISPVVYDGAPQIQALPFVVRHDGTRWLVAALGTDRVPSPGWPPEIG